MDALKLWKELFSQSKYEHNPFIASEQGGDVSCFYCGEYQPLYPKETKHADNCVYVKAKKLLEDNA